MSYCRLSELDLSRYVQDARWEDPWEITAGTPLVTAIEQHVLVQLPVATRRHG